MKKIPLLKADDIEVKVKQVTEKGAIALLYKTARTDMAVLDEVFGAMNWETDYKNIKGNLYCGIGARENPSEPFVWKWDCGIESREDGEGNQKKGEASDAFKRAGFKWGIGRELYTAPFIFITADTEQISGGKGYKLKDRYASYSVESIGYDDNRNITGLKIADKNGEIVYQYPKKGVAPKPKKQDNDLPFGDIPESLTCEFCNNEISPSVSKSGKPVSAEQIVETSKKRYNKQLCVECAAKLAKDAEQK